MSAYKLHKPLLKDLYPIRFLLLISFLLYFPITFLNIIQPLIVGYAAQEGIFSGDINKIYYFSFLFFLSLIVASCLEMVQSFLLQKSGQFYVKILRERAFAKIQKLSINFLDTIQLGKILTRLINDPESVAEVFSMGAIQVVGDFFFLIGTFVMLFFTDITLSFYSFLSLPILIIGMIFFRYWIKVAFIKARAALSNLNSFFSEYLMGNATVQSFNRIAFAQNEFRRNNGEFIKANKMAVFLDAAVYSFVDAISYIACAFVLLGGYNLQKQGMLQLGILIAFIQALNRFFQPIKDFSSRYAIIQSSFVSLERIYELFSWPEEKDSASKNIKKDFKDEISFSNVSFSYNNIEKILKNINFTVKKNKRVAIVGRTGAGKSTVIKLMSRFYIPNDGEIRIDGENIQDISLESLRNLITVVPQEVFLFKATLRDNLAFGRLDATDEEIWQALRLVQLSNLVQKIGGLDALVDTKGQNFSQGEKQLLSFARAIIANRPIVILDEATANVDVRTEKRLKAATQSLLENKTAIIIAHRLSTIVDSDEILFFEHGKILYRGSHEELLTKSPEYFSMIKEQEHKA